MSMYVPNTGSHKRCPVHSEVAYPATFEVCQVDGCSKTLQPCNGPHDALWGAKVQAIERQEEREEDKVVFVDTTAQNIYDWRLHCLTFAGYDDEVATILAAGKEDLHRLVLAKATGCTDQLALLIFT